MIISSFCATSSQNALTVTFNIRCVRCCQRYILAYSNIRYLFKCYFILACQLGNKLKMILSLKKKKIGSFCNDAFNGLGILNQVLRANRFVRGVFWSATVVQVLTYSCTQLLRLSGEQNNNCRRVIITLY